MADPHKFPPGRSLLSESRHAEPRTPEGSWQLEGPLTPRGEESSASHAAQAEAPSLTCFKSEEMWNEVLDQKVNECVHSLRYLRNIVENVIVPAVSHNLKLPAVSIDAAVSDGSKDGRIESNISAGSFKKLTHRSPNNGTNKERPEENERCEFHTRPVWTSSQADVSGTFGRITSSRGQKRVFRNVPVLDTRGSLENVYVCIGRPSAPWRLFWNGIGLIAIIYDLFLIPMLLVDPLEFDVIAFLGYAAFSFWHLDIVANFTVAYHNKEGDLVASPLLMAKHYFSTWLPFDLGLLLLDWVLYVMGATGDGAGQGVGALGRAMRVIRFLRILRLMRLLKVKRFLAPILDKFSYGVTLMYMSIVKIVVGIFVMNHFLACFWFAVGSADGHGWVATTLAEARPLTHQYLESFHWCLTQFGVGASAIFPKTEGEYAFATFIDLVALVVVSYLISVLTDAMLRLQRLHHDRSEQFSIFRRYCKDRRVSKDIFTRTVKYLEYAYALRLTQTPASEVELISLLSGPLRNELQLEIWVPSISCHPFFKEFCRDEASTMQGVCKDAVAEMHFAQEDNVFVAGKKGTHMYFVVDGALEYKSKRTDLVVTVVKRKWISEAAIWTEWVHLGLLSVEIECSVLALEADAFMESMKGHLGALMKVKRYADRYVRVLNKTSLDDLSDVDSDTFLRRLQAFSVTTDSVGSVGI